MSFKRMWALFVARNREFIRDKAGFGWNILFPFFIVAGFGFLFNSDSTKQFTIGVFSFEKQIIEQYDKSKNKGLENQKTIIANLDIPEKLKNSKHIKIVLFENFDQAIDKLLHHKIDILLENQKGKLKYWISDSSPDGYAMEKIIKESIISDDLFALKVVKQQIKGMQIRYIDWLLPGIIGMNIMFSSFFGVGYIIVRYRRNKVLKRLKATPVTAFEYLTAQLVSRVLILVGSAFIVWFGCDLIFSFQMRGSYFDVFIIFLAGSICLSSLGLLVACRGTNEELTNGIINFICWPMMFLSEVWFSLEGATHWMKQFAKIFPLTHFLSAIRKIMNDGASLSDVSFEFFVLIIMGLVFLSIGSFLFSWTR